MCRGSKRSYYAVRSFSRTITRAYSVYSAREDEYGIRKFEGKLTEETYHNGLVIVDYWEKMSELGLDERDVMRAEKEWVEPLSIEGAAACLAYHFRRDHFCEGSLIQKGIADGCILRLMERSYKLLSTIGAVKIYAQKCLQPPAE